MVIMPGSLTGWGEFHLTAFDGPSTKMAKRMRSCNAAVSPTHALSQRCRCLWCSLMSQW